MASKGKVDRAGSDGRHPSRILAAGYGQWTIGPVIDEAIYGAQAARRARSIGDGHRHRQKPLLSSRFREVGIGAATAPNGLDLLDARPGCAAQHLAVLCQRRVYSVDSSAVTLTLTTENAVRLARVPVPLVSRSRYASLPMIRSLALSGSRGLRRFPSHCKPNRNKKSMRPTGMRRDAPPRTRLRDADQRAHFDSYASAHLTHRPPSHLPHQHAKRDGDSRANAHSPSAAHGENNVTATPPPITPPHVVGAGQPTPRRRCAARPGARHTYRSSSRAIWRAAQRPAWIRVRLASRGACAGCFGICAARCGECQLQAVNINNTIHRNSDSAHQSET